MSTKTEVKTLYKMASDYNLKTITVKGWAKTIRDSKAFGFIELNDGTYFKSGHRL